MNDYAGVVAPATARQLNDELVQLERESSNQIVVAVFPKMQSDSSVEDYTLRVARSWGVGTKEHNNGVVLFVFTEDRKLYIQVGTGLESALSNRRCKRIIDNEIVPHFRANDYTGGIAAGVHALIASTKGEYGGTGQTIRETFGDWLGNGRWFFVLIVVVVILGFLFPSNRSRCYFGGGYNSYWWSNNDDDWGGGGGSFSGGGGSFGGGGAGGSW